MRSIAGSVSDKGLLEAPRRRRRAHVSTLDAARPRVALPSHPSAPRRHAKGRGPPVGRPLRRRASLTARMDEVGDDPRLGTTLDGRYKLTERIAQGSMGVVYR